MPLGCARGPSRPERPRAPAAPRDRVELVRSFESDAVRVSLDTGHADDAHRATGGPPVDVHIHVAGDLLTHVHLQDTDGFADRHWMPGEGDIPWPSIFAALESLASRPRLILELADATKVPAAARRLDAQGSRRVSPRRGLP